jgi:hypothetical protein
VDAAETTAAAAFPKNPPNHGAFELNRTSVVDWLPAVTLNSSPMASTLS